MSTLAVGVKLALADVCEMIVDCEHKTAPTQEFGVPSIRTPNIGRGRLLLEGVNRVAEDTYREWTRRAPPQPGDLILAREAPVGNVAIIPPGLRVCLGQRTVLLRADRRLAEPEYLVYLLLGPEMRGRLLSTTNGATVGHLNVEEIKRLALPRLPPLPLQRKIGAILSAYDDLIENNTRRIAILEEMAQALYREWFVNFRFPGHQDARMVDSEIGPIPEGWRVAALGDQCSLVDGDWIETKDQGGNDYRLLQVSNIGLGSFVETGNFRYVTQQTFERLHCQEILPGDILISRMPRPTGRAWLVTRQPWRMITAVDVAIARTEPEKANKFFVLALLNSPDQLAQVEKRTTGTTRARIARSTLSSLRVVVPPVGLQNTYGAFVEPLHELNDSIQRQNVNLRQTRDLMLPRLISGDVDVSELDIRVPEPME